MTYKWKITKFGLWRRRKTWIVASKFDKFCEQKFDERKILFCAVFKDYRYMRLFLSGVGWLPCSAFEIRATLRCCKSCIEPWLSLQKISSRKLELKKGSSRPRNIVVKRTFWKNAKKVYTSTKNRGEKLKFYWKYLYLYQLSLEKYINGSSKFTLTKLKNILWQLF